jgi:hypothetical protein
MWNSATIYNYLSNIVLLLVVELWIGTIMKSSATIRNYLSNLVILLVGEEKIELRV